MNIIASNRPFQNSVVGNPEELKRYLLDHKDVDRIYFPFWSWTVEDWILNKYDCIGFHSAPLPKGKGGTPIQNMIRLGHDTTDVCAFKMTSEIDGGEVLLRYWTNLCGTLEEIIERISDIIDTMIYRIENDDLEAPVSGFKINYSGIPDEFERITDNQLPEKGSLKSIYDEIRMRDCPNHPKTFIPYGKFKLDFTKSVLTKGKVTAVVEFYENEL